MGDSPGKPLSCNGAFRSSFAGSDCPGCPEADAKAAADPYLLYGGYYRHGLGYYGHGLGYGLRYYGQGLGYAGYHGLGYYGHGLRYYGKRSAEAEPKAAADPYLLYGGYGLGYAGHYGYGYPYATYGYYG